MGKKSKRTAPLPPSKGKEARHQPPSVLQQKPTWGFTRVDWDGPWCWSKLEIQNVRKVLERLGNFETMPWSEIEGRRDHCIPVEHLSSEAQKRIVELKLDDQERLISLHFGGEERALGVRTEAVLQFLWWDQDHTACVLHPSSETHIYQTSHYPCTPGPFRPRGARRAIRQSHRRGTRAPTR
jgi:hypothetical protein